MTVAAEGSSASSTPLRIPVFVLLGAVVGVVGALAAAAGPPWAVFLAHYGAGYVLLIALIGVLAPSPITAAVRSPACFVPFVVAYYAAVQIRFGAIPMLYAAAWLAAALIVCPAAALIVRWSRNRSAPVGAIIAACAPAGVLADGTVRNAVLWLFGRFQGWELDPTFAAIDLVIVAVIILIVPRRPSCNPWHQLQVLAGLQLKLGVARAGLWRIKRGGRGGRR